MKPPSFNTVSIDRIALQNNFNLLKSRAGTSALLAMVKADAYGHGMIECCRALEEVGCNIFGVAELREAVLLRQSGVSSALFSMIGFAPDCAELFIQYEIIPVAYDYASLQALSSAAVKLKKDIAVHIKVDTGMSRLGIQLEEIDEILTAVDALPAIRLGGIASHFPCADDQHSQQTLESYRKFEQFLRKAKSPDNLIHHIANSGATLYFPETACDMVRCGISLYGYYPEGREPQKNRGLQPVMSFSTRVLQVKVVPPGTGVSYGHTYVTERPTTLAVLPVGYEDGYSRQLSNCGEVLIRGVRAPIRGRVCMNLCMVDVTDIQGVQAGDRAVLLGRQGNEEITADEIGRRAGTISYEVLCMIGNNNERVFI